jgi:hypothetical protein
MDVGAAGSNLLINQDQPVHYFDLGFPMNVFKRSTPANIRAGAPAPSGPILQNTAGNLDVFLSHWDWDHWRLAHIWGITVLPWTDVAQPVGPSAANFIAGLANRLIYGGAASTVAADYVLYQCVPVGAGAATPATVMNNSGLAMGIPTLMPSADPWPHMIVLTGDANFDSVPALHPLYPNVSAIGAAHHGSNANGAAANIPAPVAAYAGAGWIAYSYGVKQLAAGGWFHCYGFPVPAAVAAYTAAGWGTPAAPPLHASTAEGVNLNGPLPVAPPAVRGNIRVADPTALNAAYNATAYFAFPNALN